MSRVLYANLFTTCQPTSFDLKRKKKSKMKEKLAKLGVYAGFIASCSAMSADALQYTAIASVVCLVMECFR